MAKRREIRNSTAEFLIFQIEVKGQGIEVYYKDKTVWCTQKAMGMLFDCTSDNISVHLQNIYDTDELKREATTEKISVVRREGNRDVNRTRLLMRSIWIWAGDGTMPGIGIRKGRLWCSSLRAKWPPVTSIGLIGLPSISDNSPNWLYIKNLENSLSKLGVRRFWPRDWRISSRVQKRPPSSSSVEGLIGPS